MPKLLIVDDEEATVDMLATYLGLIGHETVSAHSGYAGLTLAKAEKPDLMLLDLMMPDLQGHEVCTSLRQESYGTLPILIISARTDQGSIDKALSSGADGYFTKPLDLPSLTQEIARLLANPPVRVVEPNGEAKLDALATPEVTSESTENSTEAPTQPEVKPQVDDKLAPANPAEEKPATQEQNKDDKSV